MPAVDNPKYVSIKDADSWLKPIEPVIGIEVNGQARAYPLQILMWHEIVNDTLNGEPLIVTFFPLATLQSPTCGKWTGRPWISWVAFMPETRILD